MGLIPEDSIQQVLDRADIVQIITSYIPLKRAGRNFKANCPFHHEKSPSFIVNPDKQIYHCFGCGVGGNVISFVMRQERLEFPEAVHRLAEKVGVIIAVDERSTAATNSRQLLYRVNDLAVQFFHQNLLSSPSASAKGARDYLKSRRVSLDTVKKFKLGFALDEWDSLIGYLRKHDVTLKQMEQAGLIVVKENREGFYDRFRNRVIFPIFDSRSQSIGFGARTLEKEAGAKYINSPETPLYIKGNHFYGFHSAKEAIGKADCVIIVEGYMDFLMPFQAGVENIAASLGTALTVEQIRLAHRYTQNVILLFDADPAGEAAMLRSLDLLIEEDMNVKVASLPKGEDPDSFVAKYGVEALQERIKAAQSLFDYKLKMLSEKYDIKTVEGRGQIAKAMLQTLAKFTNEVVKFGYLKKFSEILNVPPEAMITEMKKMGSSFSVPVVLENTFVGRELPLRPVETSILRLMLEEAELIRITKEEVKLSDFRDEKVRNIVNKIFQLFEEGKAVDSMSLMNSFGDEKIQQTLSSLVVGENLSLMGDKKKIHRDCLNRLKSDRLQSVRRDLCQQIKRAEVLGDHNRLDELKGQFNQLIKGSYKDEK